MVAGREFTLRDTVDAPGVALINEAMAARFWPNGDAIGKHLWNDPKQQMEIVGVVGTVKQYGLDVDGRIVLYRPAPRNPHRYFSFSFD